MGISNFSAIQSQSAFCSIYTAGTEKYNPLSLAASWHSIKSIAASRVTTRQILYTTDI